MHATLDEAKVARVPYIWVDNDLSFAHGHIQGFPKKLGSDRDHPSRGRAAAVGPDSLRERRSPAM